MGIFRYGTPFMNFMSRLVDILVLGIVALVCSLPMVTVGASLTAVYYVCLKMVRGRIDSNLGTVLKTYFKAFKENFWKSTALWLIMALVITVVYVDFTLLISRDMAYESALWIVIVILSILAAMVASYVFPLQAQFENTVGGTIKNAFILSIMNLPKSILILLIKISPILVAFFNPVAMYILAVFCLAGIPYLETEMFIKIFNKYIPDEEEYEYAEEEAADGEWTESTATPVLSTGDDLAPEVSAEE